jgi:uncharacterized protein YndB with AHSA1/START domain
VTDRSIDLSVEVPGTVEEVWRTIATGPGISSWFIPHEVDEREGGEVVMDFGSFGKESATVEAWDPPHRLLLRGRDDDRGGHLAYEWLVEAKDGGTCVVRLVNSGFGPGAEWDADFEGMSSGWRLFLENLRLHRTHFPGQVPVSILPTVMTAGPHADAWSKLCGTLGIGTALAAGDRVSGALGLSGTIERAVFEPKVSAYALVLDGPAPGTAFVTDEGEGDVVGASAYLYLYGAGASGVDPSAWEGQLRSALEPVEGAVEG